MVTKLDLFQSCSLRVRVFEKFRLKVFCTVLLYFYGLASTKLLSVMHETFLG